VLRNLAYALYARRLRSQLAGQPVPGHVALIMDGNRRWARQMGLASPSLGHKYGAEHIEDVLRWCATAGIKHVTVFVCSTENLLRRDDAEIAFLMQVVEDVVARKLAAEPTWQVHIAGLLDVLPDSTARALKTAVSATRDCATGAHVTLAIGYGGRQEVVDAVVSLLYEHGAAGGTLADLAQTLTGDDIARHLYTAGQPDPDLVIRTSGEQRLSNFLLWQSVGSELYFCEAYWPGFREIDFLRALRSYAARQRRPGS
jgi:short-chain Z-isoprenyl diphosphate synthase